MMGIAGVVVPSWHRGRGLARRLMSEALRECRERGYWLSTLFPSTETLYRGVGYERAGTRFIIDLTVGALPRVPAPDGRVVRPATDADEDGLRALYADLARSRDGMLDRGPYSWARARATRDKVALGHVVVDPAQPETIEGYVFLHHDRSSGKPKFALDIIDMAASNKSAALALLRFFFDHRSMVDHVVWRGGPDDPLLALAGEAAAEVRLEFVWMTRLTDVAKALSARGYRPGLSGVLELDVVDELIEGSSGRIVLEVADGRGVVERGGGGALKIDVRGLAALYSGCLTAEQLACCSDSLVDTSEEQLALASSLFAGPSPNMPDMF